jgi:signal transduction histidine kinase
VRNAVRYTKEGTAVHVSLECGDGRTALRVCDYGPGVPENMLTEIFLPFRRVSNGDGAGLGLAIAQRAVQVHRGTIRAMNAADGGLVIEIALKIEP